MTLVRIFWSQVAFKAELARAALEASGIVAQMRGTGLIPGAMGIDTRIEVWVPEDAVDDALEVLGLTGPRWSDAEVRDKVGRLSLAELEEEAGRLSLAKSGGELAMAEPPSCPQCDAAWEPGFDICWNCQHQLTNPGLGPSP